MTSNLWASADAYELYMGRWSRRVAAQFLDWLDVPPGATWLDVGCGTGALTQAILGRHASRVTGIEPSEAFVAQARASVNDPRATFVHGGDADIGTLGTFDAVVSGLVLNFLPDARVAIGRMAQAVLDGGVVAAYVWDYAEGMQLMRYFWDAASELDSAASALDEGRRATICNPATLTLLFASALSSVEVREIVIDTPFESFEAYWRPFMGGVGPGPAYAVALDEPNREALRGELQARLPVQPDGSIPLQARAWAVKGRRVPD
jgi:trans-aconitate methyltransferase